MARRTPSAGREADPIASGARRGGQAGKGFVGRSLGAASRSASAVGISIVDTISNTVHHVSMRSVSHLQERKIVRFALVAYAMALLGLPLHFILEPHVACGDSLCHVLGAGAGEGRSHADPCGTAGSCGSGAHHHDSIPSKPGGGLAFQFAASGASTESCPLQTDGVALERPTLATLDRAVVTVDDPVETVEDCVLPGTIPRFRLAPKNSPNLPS